MDPSDANSAMRLAKEASHSWKPHGSEMRNIHVESLSRTGKSGESSLPCTT